MSMRQCTGCRFAAAGLLGILLGLLSSTGGAMDLEWSFLTSPDGDANGRRVAPDRAGGLYLVGDLRDSVTVETLTLAPEYASGFYALHLDPAGHPLWGRTYSGLWADYVRAAGSDAEGNLFIAGQFCSPSLAIGETTLVNVNPVPYPDWSTFDFFIAKLSPAGKVLWARMAGGIYDEHVTDLTVDRSGAVCLLGTFTSPSIPLPDGTTLPNTGNHDLYAVKYDADGQFAWAIGGVGNGQENAWSIASDSQDRIYLAGSFRSPTLTLGDQSLINSSDDFDLYLFQCAPDGTAQWVRGARGENWDDGEAVCVDEADRPYLCGHFRSDSLCFEELTLLLSPCSLANNDLYLAGFSPEGDLLWATTSRGGAWLYPHALCAPEPGRLALIGTLNGMSGDWSEWFGDVELTPIDSYDIFLAQFTDTGHALWAEVYGGDGMDFGQHVAAGDAGEFCVAAYIGSDSATIAGQTLINPWSHRAFTGLLRPAPAEVPIGPKPAQRVTALTLQPNPTRGSTQITCAGWANTPLALEIVDPAGRRVRRIHVPRGGGRNAQVVWDGCGDDGRPVATGVYFCQLKTPRCSKTVRVVCVR